MVGAQGGRKSDLSQQQTREIYAMRLLLIKMYDAVVHASMSSVLDAPVVLPLSAGREDDSQSIQTVILVLSNPLERGKHEFDSIVAD